MFWNTVERECQSCSKIDESCDTCTQDGKCLTCKGGAMAEKDGLSCIPKFTNCAESSLASQP